MAKTWFARSARALLTYGAVTPKQRIEPFDEARAEQLEAQVAELVEAGAPEDKVRALVRDAMRVRVSPGRTT